MTTTRPRVGLVLGAGGVAAQAFHAGLLAALHDVVGFDARSAEIVVGTSAGASTGALVRAGLSGGDLVRRACGEPADERVAALMERMGPPVDLAGLRSRRPRRLGGLPASPELLQRAARRPWVVRPGTVGAALAPAGHVPWRLIADPIDRVLADGWPAEPLWLCAVRLDDGARVVFGRPRETARSVSVGTAVAASCAIPGLCQPVDVSGIRYVDGGVWSATNADVLAGEELDVVVVSSPMTVRAGAWTRDAPLRMILRWRVIDEVATLRRQGVSTVVVEPAAGEAQAMGADALDQSRREMVTRHVLASVTTRLRHGDLRRALAAVGMA